MSPKKLRYYEARGVGLLAAGAYVLSNIKDAALEQIASRNHDETEWASDVRIISITSPRGRGTQARFGWISSCRNWLRYPGLNASYGSVEAFKARVETPQETIRRALATDVVKVRKPGATNRLPKEAVGLLMDLPDRNHNTLLTVKDGLLYLLPYEKEPPAHSYHEFAYLEPVPQSGAEEIRAMFANLSEKAKFPTDFREVVNTRIPFALES